MMFRICRAMIITATLAGISAVALAATHAFGPESMREIEQGHAGDPFIVALWATDCSPCRRELELLRAFNADHPAVPVVLIATDDLRNASLVQTILSEFGLTRVESWLFSGGGVERLQYSVDPDWSGEVPRSYLYDRDVNRIVITGAASRIALDSWIESLR
jgi:thiol-disulfide isomerase/thioredoxin